MLDHPWLAMPDDYNYRMNDLEFKKFKLRQTIESVNDDFMKKEPGHNKKKRTDYNEYQDK